MNKHFSILKMINFNKIKSNFLKNDWGINEIDVGNNLYFVSKFFISKRNK